MPPDTPTSATRAAPTEVKRDAAAAARLPELYATLKSATDLLERARAQKPDVHTVEFNIGADTIRHHPADRQAFADHLMKDFEGAVAKAKAEIEALGFKAD